MVQWFSNYPQRRFSRDLNLLESEQLLSTEIWENIAGGDRRGVDNGRATDWMTDLQMGLICSAYPNCVSQGGLHTQ